MALQNIAGCSGHIWPIGDDFPDTRQSRFCRLDDAQGRNLQAPRIVSKAQDGYNLHRLMFTNCFPKPDTEAITSR
jgi:hypothetical protein